MKFKRSLSFILAMIMLLSMVPTSFGTQDETADPDPEITCTEVTAGEGEDLTGEESAQMDTQTADDTQGADPAAEKQVEEEKQEEKEEEQEQEKEEEEQEKEEEEQEKEEEEQEKEEKHQPTYRKNRYSLQADTYADRIDITVIGAPAGAGYSWQYIESSLSPEAFMTEYNSGRMDEGWSSVSALGLAVSTTGDRIAISQGYPNMYFRCEVSADGDICYSGLFYKFVFETPAADDGGDDAGDDDDNDAGDVTDVTEGDESTVTDVDGDGENSDVSNDEDDTEYTAEQGEGNGDTSGSGEEQNTHTHTPDYKKAPFLTIMPTCTTDGFTVYVCECGEQYYGDTVPATGHNFENGVCKACGEKKQTEAKGGDDDQTEEHVHVPDGNEGLTIKAGREAHGYTEYKCGDCGEKYQVDITHFFENGVCTVCGEEDPEAAAAVVEEPVEEEPEVEEETSGDVLEAAGEAEPTIPVTKTTNTDEETGEMTVTLSVAPEEGYESCVWQYSEDGGKTWNDVSVLEGAVVSGTSLTVPADMSAQFRCVVTYIEEVENEDGVTEQKEIIVCSEVADTAPQTAFNPMKPKRVTAKAPEAAPEVSDYDYVKGIIERLDNPDDITFENVYTNNVLLRDIAAKVGNSKEEGVLASDGPDDPLNDEKTELYNKYAAVSAKCAEVLEKEEYSDVQTGSESFGLIWNDNNNENNNRPVLVEPSGLNIVTATNARLCYRIMCGGEEAGSGTLADAEAARNEFQFLGEAVTSAITGDILTCSADSSASYAIKTNAKLPVSYTVKSVDPDTGVVKEKVCTIEYYLDDSFKSPSDKYIITKDFDENPHSGSVILTELKDWQADVEWYDDNNRSADGGNSDTNRPRPDDSAFLTNMEVYSSDPSVVVSADCISYDEQTGKISLTGLPAYDNEGNPITYHIVCPNIDAANTEAVLNNAYAASYENTDNFATKTDGIYDDGKLRMVLTNSEPFKVTKVWNDGLTGEEREANSSINPTYSVWRMVEEYDEASGTYKRSEAVPVPNTSSVNVPKRGDLTTIFGESLPMYDNEGRRYIYFGLESAVGGDYKTTIDNGSYSPAAVKDSFDAQGKYFLNGATITNELSGTKNVPVTKEFKAQSVQNISPIEVRFILQKYDEASASWVSASSDDVVECDREHVTISEDGVILTLTDFIAKDMTDSFNSVTVQKYDPNNNYKSTRYRWVETGFTVNGGSAKLSEGWSESGVYNGNPVQMSDLTGPDNTTAFYTAVYDENTLTYTNTLVGDTQIEIHKTFIDENGNNITSEITGTEVYFQIFRDGELLLDEEGKPVQVELSSDNYDESLDCWINSIIEDRYDSEGREYRYTVREVPVEGYYGTEEEYIVDTVEIEYPEGSGEYITIKRITTKYSNGVGKGFEIEVEKTWLDDSDLETRNPVYAAIYRVKDVNGNFITPELVVQDILLNSENNWFKKVSISNPPEGDSADNYIAVEQSINPATGDPVSVVYINGSVASFTPEMLAAIMSPDGCEIGTVGDPNANGEDGIDWDGMCYIYRTFSQRSENKVSNLYRYTLTNLRTGKQNYELTKKWVLGGEVPTAVFGIFQGTTQLGTVTVSVEKDTNTATASVSWAEGFDNSGVNVGFKTVSEGVPTYPDTTQVTLDESGNCTLTVNVDGLPKFDRLGKQQTFAIREIKMGGQAIEDGKCVIDGVECRVSSTSGIYEYADNYNHRSPDLYKVSVSNYRSDSYDLVANKVWRDRVRQNKRPDVCFTLYRVSTQGNQGLKQAVDSGDTDSILSWINCNRSAASVVVTDIFWDTHINDYWWTCTVKNMPQYDDDGYPYVYFGVETIKGNTESGAGGGTSVYGLYKGYYCNLTERDGYRPIPYQGADIDTQKVFDIPNDQLPSMDGTVFILSDGVHKASNDSYADYYSATVVNRPEKDRTVSGKKLWKLPLGWIIPENYFPPIEIDLYRTKEEFSYQDPVYKVDGVTNANLYAQAIIAAATELCHQEAPLSTYTIDQPPYTYSFADYADGNERVPLHMYDEWGEKYYYYTLENVGDVTDPDRDERIYNFPSSKIQYIDNDFNITNVFSPESPFVEITVKKTWKLDETYIKQHSRDGNITNDVTGLDTTDLKAVTVTLYGAPLNNSGTVISDKVELPISQGVHGVTLSPRRGESTDGTVYSTERVGGELIVSASYKFTEYYDEELGPHQKLTYYWIKSLNNGLRVQYSAEETTVNGYVSTTTNADPIELVKENEELYKNAYTITVDGTQQTVDGTVFENIYQGDETSFEFSKYWLDNYVDNDEFRPDSITFEIRRRTKNQHTTYDDTDSFSRTVTLYKDDQNNAGHYIWKGKIENLLKYDPDGNEYEYYVYSESVTVEGETQTATIVDGGTIGNYTLDKDSSTDSRFFNRLTHSVEVSGTKTWDFGTEGLDDDRFANLAAMGVLPKTVQYIVQRRALEADIWEYVPASDYYAPYKKIQNPDGEGQILGREIAITSAASLNPVEYRWENLPDTYSYRVIERLIWASGTVVTLTPGNTKGHGITAKFDSDDTTRVYNIENTPDTQKAKIAKEWVDNYGSQNTRPTTMTVTIASADALDAGRTFTLRTSGNTVSGNQNANIYYSDEFEVSNINGKDDFIYGLASGNTYTITESYEANGVTYSQTISSSDIPVTMENNVVILKIRNTWTDIKTIDLKAEKEWSGDTAWSDVTRPNVYYQLQYREKGSETWKNFTDDTIENFRRAPEGSSPVSAIQKVYDSATRNHYVASWTYMLKYWETPTTDGVPEPIRYRVVEIFKDASDQVINSTSYIGYSAEFENKALKPDPNPETLSAQISNSLQKRDIKVTKEWHDSSTAEKLDSATISALISINALPEKVTYTLLYKTEDTSEYIKVPKTGTIIDSNGSFTCKTTDLISGVRLSKVVPEFDGKGQKISYKVEEYSLIYKNNVVVLISETGFTPTDAVQTLKSTGITVFPTTNSYTSGRISVQKVWKDSHDRDGVRDESVRLYLIRDGYDVTPTTNREYKDLNSTGTGGYDGVSDVYTFEHLPLYKNGSTSVLSDYLVDEVNTSNISSYYETYYETNPADVIAAGTKTKDTRVSANATGYSSADVNLLVVYNVHHVHGRLAASKSWDDTEQYEQRPKEDITLTLKYFLEGDPGMDNWNNWHDVDHVDSVPDFNQNLTGGDQGVNVYTTSPVSQTITYNPSTNKWSTVSWENLPAKVLVEGMSKKIIYSAYDIVTGYSCILTRDSTAEFGIIMKDVQENIPITVTNKAEAGYSVTKVWDDSENAFNSRPDCINVKLQYRGKNGGEPTAWTDVPNGGGVLNPSNRWTTSWTGLRDIYEYRAIEVELVYADGTVTVTATDDEDGSGSQHGTAGNYEYSSDVTPASESSNGNTVLTNKLPKIGVHVEKIWKDEENRDGVRPASVTFVLKRDGTLIAVENEKRTASADNGWKADWDRLPKYKNGSTTEPSVYEVVEEATGESPASLGYIVTYSPVNGVNAEEGSTADNTITVTNTYEPIRFPISAKKHWNDFNNIYKQRPDSVKLEVQYSLTPDDAESWTTVDTTVPETDDGTTVYTRCAQQQTLTGNPTAADWESATWTDLPAYVRINTGAADEPVFESRPVYYRVVEATPISSNYQPKVSGTISYADYESTGRVELSVVNKLEGFTSVSVTKFWEDFDDKFDQRPYYVTVQLQYKGKGSAAPADWTDVEGGGYDLKASENWTHEWENLIDDYVYRVIEKSISYRGGLTINVTSSDGLSGSAGCYTFSTEIISSDDDGTAVKITNTLVTGELAVQKNWNDDGDRDKGRPESITVQLYRNETEFGSLEILNADNDWEFEWTGLPVLPVSGSPAYVYTVKEIGENSGSFTGKNGVVYTVTYSDGVTLDNSAAADTATLTVTNKHVPYHGSLIASKTWEDYNNRYASRPGSIELTLEYYKYDSETGEWSWTDVPGTAGEDGVSTTSDNPQTVTATALGGWHDCTWNDLLVNSDGQPIRYRVFETTVSGYTPTYSYSGAAEGYAELTANGGTYKATAGVKNTLDETGLVIEKTWKPDDYGFLAEVMPSAVHFKVECSNDNGTTWNSDGAVYTADAAGGWKATVERLPTGYQYRVSETEIIYTVGGATYAVDAAGSFNEDSTVWTGTAGPFSSTVTQNETEDDSFVFTAENTVETGSLKVIKDWKDGEDRDGGRETIIVDLYRDGVKIDEQQLAFDEETGEYSYTWTDLPVYKNTFAEGEERSRSVYTVKEQGETGGVYVSANGIKYTAAYDSVRGVELCETEKQTVITNTHDMLRFDVSATKYWNDADNKYRLRPNEVRLKLQWTAKDSPAEGDWADVHTAEVPPAESDGGRTVFTTTQSQLPGSYNNAVVLRLTATAGNEWGTAVWKDVPANVLVDVESESGTEAVSKPVYYRVVEVGESGADGDTYRFPVSYTSSASPEKVTYTSTHSTKVTNDLTGMTHVDVIKVWFDAPGYSAHPDSITVQLQYSDDDGATWHDVTNMVVDEGTRTDVGTRILTEDNEWKASWTGIDCDGLRSDYKYRVVERSLKYGSNTIEVATENETEGTAGQYVFGTVTEYSTEEGQSHAASTITNTLVTGSLKLTKNWDDNGNRDGGRQPISVRLFRDGTAYGDDIELNSANGWTYEWENLPVYKGTFTTAGEPEKSVYTIAELNDETVIAGGGTYTGADSVQYTVSYPDGIELSSGSTENITVTNRHVPYLGSLSVTKVWAGDEDSAFGEWTAPVKVRLEYSTDGGETFEPVTQQVTTEAIAQNIPEGVYTTSDIGTSGWVTLDVGNNWSYTWENIPVNVPEGTPVEYRVTEDSSSISAGFEIEYTYKDDKQTLESDGDSISATVTNTLKTVDLVIEKSWPAGYVYEEDIVPDHATFRIEYSHDDGNIWDELSTVDLSPAAHSATVKGLPKYDAAGNEYLYRASEVSITYSGSEGGADIVVPASGSFNEASTVWTGTVGPFSSTVTIAAEKGKDDTVTGFTVRAVNEPVTGSLTVDKQWRDNADRDGGRSSIVLRLYRDGVQIGPDVTVTAGEDGSYSYTWTGLPVYKNTSAGPDGEKSVYTVVELDADNSEIASGGTLVITNADGVKVDYTVTYSDENGVKLEETTEGAKGEMTVTNTHDIFLFDVSATKLWNDGGDKYELRPKEVRLKLRYSTDGLTWRDVPHIEEAIPGPDSGVCYSVFTTTETQFPRSYDGAVVLKLTPSDTIGDGSAWGHAVWENLPAYVSVNTGTADEPNFKSKLVYYRVVEVGASGAAGDTYTFPTSYTSNASAKVTYEDALRYDDLAVPVSVINDLEGMTHVYVRKLWVDCGNDAELLPDSITVQLQYRESSEDEWKPVDHENGIKTLTAPDWSAVWLGIPVDHTGLRNDFEYRVIEVKMDYTDPAAEYSAPETDNPMIGRIGIFDYISEDETGVTEENHTRYKITNTLITGSMSVTKEWIDANDRDGGRTDSIWIQLYRDGEEYLTPVELKSANSWSHTWSKLPVYRPGAAEPEKFTYTIRELDADMNPVEPGAEFTGKTRTPETPKYKVVYSDGIQLSETGTGAAKVTNPHDIFRFSIDAAKIWHDWVNEYGLRDDSVTLEIKWSVDRENWNRITKVSAVPSSAEDDGKTVFTTSDPVQVLRQKTLLGGSNELSDVMWGYITWDNLPAYVLVREGTELVSKLVYYRLEEVASTITDCAYDSEPSRPISYYDVNKTAKTIGFVNNPLRRITSLTVKKTFVNKSTYESLKQFMPEYIVVQLQYRENSNESWKPVPKKGEVHLSYANNWSYTFERLRADYEYRAVEVEMVYRGSRDHVSRHDTKRNDLTSIKAGAWNTSCVTESHVGSDGIRRYYTSITNYFTNRPRTGDMASVAPFIATGAAALAGAGGCAGLIAGKRRKKKGAPAEKRPWQD